MSVLIRRLGARLSSPLRRGYGSAAALQLDYYPWSESESESDGWETPRRGVQWVILGDPLVRRHVYAHRLADLLGVPHISMGSLVRQELNPNSLLYKKIGSAVNEGKLVPEDVIFGLLSKRLEEGYCRGETGFILDGIPRTTIQAEILDQIADIDLVLNLKKTEKLGMYTEQMKGVEEYYKQQKKLVNFQVAGAPGDTWEGLLAALQLQHMTPNSSNKLTAY
ncbi:P-loop containing nucleoside triphosphate hydrolases superfamily protein [Perilla frutescens var. hirtella]|uniref:adenylate kinase n=1 Tax=Perilla frutescens var. hirtella TaxID=608512 RepID=A0AAD4JEJ3_PERFH|nr:P-loop containing nucleoside triphosphate hydrolases superfamily protein [Perilla frutescens var. hirtella]KAH6832370.1 P-loop containing nucleoside triphosphate hydrolases superfamily protein [Perilla frutescens var. hirtella]